MLDRGTRWNEFVPLDEADGDETVLIRTHDPFGTPTTAVAPTPVLEAVRNHFTALIVPFSLAAAFFGPATETVRRRVRSTSATNVPAMVFSDLLINAWSLQLERVAAEDVSELELLWALPYPGAPDSDFRLAE